MPPQVGAGGCTPMPRKVRNDTVSSAAAVMDAVVTAMFGSTLRSTWTRMTCSFEAPSSSAASTYWARACSRVAARVTRKKPGASRIPTGIIACTRPFPSAAVTATAKKMDGRVISASVTRLTAKSNHRPRKTVAMPGTAPSTSPIPTASSAVSTDRRVPAISRLSTSRPR